MATSSDPLHQQAEALAKKIDRGMVDMLLTVRVSDRARRDALVAVLLPALRRVQAETREERWQLIDSAPEAERIHVWVPNYGVKIALKTTHPSDGAVWWDGEEQIARPTHWMPLPQPPSVPDRIAHDE